VYQTKSFGDSEDENKPKKKVMKLIPRNMNENDLNLKKRKFEEFKLQHSKFYSDIKTKIDNYTEQDDLIEIVRSKMVKVREEHVSVEGEGEGENIEEEAPAEDNTNELEEMFGDDAEEEDQQ
jgi:hypothetical protein